VHKRQDSCGRAHVLVKGKGQRDALTCSVNPAMPMKCMGNEPLWFHQEFVDTIERFGEFRAFIVTITCIATGKTTNATVVDKCKGCNRFSIDLSNTAFLELDDLSVGRTTTV
jgi:hypothetical protein